MSNGEGASASEAPPQVAQAAVTIGTAIPGTTTIDAVFTAIYGTRTNAPGTITYRYSDLNVVQGYYSDGSMITARFEPRPFAPVVISA
jgi:hypothetical protein